MVAAIRYGAVRIESAKFGKKGVFLTGVSFLFFFTLCLAIGSKGPQVFVTKRGDENLVINRYGVDKSLWIGNLVDLTPANQLLWVSCRMKRPESVPIDVPFQYKQEISMRVVGTKSTDMAGGLGSYRPEKYATVVPWKNFTRTVAFAAGKKRSGRVNIYNTHSVQYSGYQVRVKFISPGSFDYKDGGDHQPDKDSMPTKFALTYINRGYTAFEIGWKYAFLAITVAVMMLPKFNRGRGRRDSGAIASCGLVFEGYFVKLCGSSRRVWSYQQKWVAVLLVELLLFNDPLIYFEVYNGRAGGEILGGLYIIFMASFVCTLMLFWLCALDETRSQSVASTSSGGSRKGCRKRLSRNFSKVLFMSAMWLYIVVTYTYIRMKEDGDPSYEAAEEGSRYKAATAIGAILLVSYALWFLYYVFLGLSAIRRLSPGFLFVFAITVFTFVATIVGLFIAALYPLPSASVDFLGMYGLYNLYVWAMAFVYAPIDDREGQTGFEDLDEHKEIEINEV